MHKWNAFVPSCLRSILISEAGICLHTMGRAEDTGQINSLLPGSYLARIVLLPSFSIQIAVWTEKSRLIGYEQGSIVMHAIFEIFHRALVS